MKKLKLSIKYCNSKVLNYEKSCRPFDLNLLSDIFKDVEHFRSIFVIIHTCYKKLGLGKRVKIGKIVFYSDKKINNFKDIFIQNKI